MHGEGRRYRVLQAVGRGGFGTVYKAELLAAGGFRKQVALKVLNEQASSDPEFSGRLRDEARMLGLINHPSVVRVDGLSMLDGRWTVVMEYIDGVDLKRLLTAGPVPLGPALEIAEKVADALHAVYDAPQSDGQPLRLLHRDIKPSNIHLTPGGTVKVLDFGVARADFEHRESHTRSRFFGSANYMAPERFDAIDSHAGDVYALGAVLVELLLGEPMGRTSANPDRHHARVGRALDAVAARVPEAVVALLQQLVAYEPADRPSARVLRRTLRRLRASVGGDLWLADYAEEVVRPLAIQQKPVEDDLSGSILEEGASAETFASAVASPADPAPERPPVDSSPESSSWRPKARARSPRRAPLPRIPPVASPAEEPSDAAAPPAAAEGASTPPAEPAPEPVSLASPEPPAASPAAPPTPTSPTLQRAAGAVSGVVGVLAALALGLGALYALRDQLFVPRVGEIRMVSAPAHDAATIEELAAETTPRATLPSSPPAAASPAPEPAAQAPSAQAPSAQAPSAQASSERPSSGPQEAPAAAETAQVLFAGGATQVWLVGASRTYPPGAVPTGTYTVEADFDGTRVQAGSVTVEPGAVVRLSCRAALRRCIPR